MYILSFIRTMTSYSRGRTSAWSTLASSAHLVVQAVGLVQGRWACPRRSKLSSCCGCQQLSALLIPSNASSAAAAALSAKPVGTEKRKRSKGAVDRRVEGPVREQVNGRWGAVWEDMTDGKRGVWLKGERNSKAGLQARVYVED